MINWDEKYPRRDMGNGKIRAVGMGMAMQGSGISGMDVGSATLKLNDDGFYTLIDNVPPVGLSEEDRRAQRTIAHWNPYREMFGLLWHGRRHVMMGPVQVDRYGNANIAAIGDWARPKSQVLGFRGAPGNTINHTTSYWVPTHNAKTFVERVDVVSGVGTDRAAALPAQGGRFHELRRVVTNLAVFDFETPDASMRLRSVHPGVTVDEVTAATGFAITVPDDVAESRLPTDEELRLIREVIDPEGLRYTEVPRD